MIEKLIRFSKINQLLIVVCIFFPFFYTGCSDAELVEERVLLEDMDEEESLDTIVQVPKDEKKEIVDTLEVSESTHAENKFNDKDKFTTDFILEEYPSLKFLFHPNKNENTGLAEVVNLFPYATVYGVFIYFLLVFLTLLFKFIDKNAVKIFLSLNIIAFIFLYTSLSFPHVICTRIWGYWLSMVLLITVIIFDSIILIVSIKNKNSPLTN